MIVLLVPGLTARDIERPEPLNLHELAARSDVGWMNARTARVSGRYGSEDLREEIAACLTLGSGSRAAASADARAAGAGALDRLRAANSRLDHTVQIGALGDILHGAGLKTAVIGNADDDLPDRAARLIAMDSAGQIDFDLSDEDQNEVVPLAPFGVRTRIDDPANSPPADFQVWVFGDLIRAERYAAFCLPDAAARHRFQALQRLDLRLGQAVQMLRAGPVRLILLAPAAVRGSVPADRLAPILVADDNMPPGLLTSGSTHVSGLVANTDFLPTVAAFFGVKVPPGMVGRIMFTTDGPAGMPRWVALHDRWLADARMQEWLGGLPTLQMILVALATAAGLHRREPFARLIGAIALIILAIPLAELLLPMAAPARVSLAAAELAAALLVLAGAAYARAGWRRGLGAAISVALSTVVVGDLAVGSRLLHHAWLSYSMMEGARFYGIGNEYGAAALASVFLAIALGFRKCQLKPGIWLSLPALAVAVVIGLPSLGANAGCAAAALVAAGAAAVVWARGRIRAHEAAAIVAAAVLLVVGALLFDLTRPAGLQTHFARAIADGGGLAGIAFRKVDLNLYLLTHSVWSAAGIIAGVGLWLLLRRPESPIRRQIEGSRLLKGCAAGLVAGATSVLLFNDSGVVAAALMVLAAWAGAALLAADEAHARPA